jgi:hypothetical protein
VKSEKQGTTAILVYSMGQKKTAPVSRDGPTKHKKVRAPSLNPFKKRGRDLLPFSLRRRGQGDEVSFPWIRH